MKVLILVISSNTQPVYREHKQVWRSYMKSHPDIDCYFIESRQIMIGHPHFLTEDTLYVRGDETYETIVRKTIRAMEYFLVRKSYDFVVRTNLSSVWIFPRLLAFLATIPRTEYYGGVICRNQQHPFVSGAGIILSADTCARLLENRGIALSSKIADDVDIGVALLKAGILPVSAPRVDVYSVDDTTLGGFHYRVRFLENRESEPGLMKMVLQRNQSS